MEFGSTFRRLITELKIIWTPETYIRFTKINLNYFFLSIGKLISIYVANEFAATY